MNRDIARTILPLALTLSACVALSGCAAEVSDVGSNAPYLTPEPTVTLSLPPQASCVPDCPLNCSFVCEDANNAAGICCTCTCGGGGGSSGGEEDGTILWEIVDVESDEPWDVLAGETFGGGLIFTVVERDVRGDRRAELVGPDGRTRCTFDRGILADAGGRRLFEVRDGSVYRPSGRAPAFTFDRDGVRGASGEVVLLSSPDQTDATPVRKAVIAALYDGLCR